MPLTSDIKQWRVKTLPGENNKFEDLELQDRWVEKARNCRFEPEPGSVDKRLPVTFYNITSLGSSPMVGLFRHYGSGGNIKSISIHGTKAYVGDDALGTWTQIRDSLTSGKRMAFKTYQDLTIMSNGFDNPFVYDGSSDNVTWELGSCKALIGSSTGITATSVSYQVTIDTDSYVCGAVSNEIASLSNEDVELTNIPLGPAGSANRKIYRKDSGTAGAYKLVTTIADNSTTTYTDSTVSASLGATVPAVTDAMPKGSVLNIHRERLFISVDPNNANRIYYSNPYLPHYIQQTTNLDFMEITPEDGDEIMGIPVHLGLMVCIKKNSLRKLHITSPVSGADPTTWFAEDPSSFTGTPAQWSVVQTQRGVVFLGWDHWKLWDGATVRDIIDEFDTGEILAANYKDVAAHWLQNDILLASYTEAIGANQFNDCLMRWNFRRSALSCDTINVNVIASHTGDDESGEVFYGASDAGFVYKTELTPLLYKLQTKDEAESGIKNNTYVGGTQSSPYIEIGSVVLAAAIPIDICVFWEDSISDPGMGWTEITAYDGKWIKISDTDSVGTSADVGISDGTEQTLNFNNYRVFKKNSSTTEFELPEGAIVMWEQPSVPVGFLGISDFGYYVKINSDLSTPSGQAVALMKTGTGGTNIDHTVGFRFIKKVGEQDTWDGISNHIYSLYDPSNNAVTADNTTDKFTDTAHGLENDDQIQFGGTTAPAGISFSTVYFVVNKTANDFQVSLTQGGAAVDFTTDGTSVTYQIRKHNGWTDVSSTYQDRYPLIEEDGPTTTDGDTSSGTLDFIQFSTTSHIYTGGTGSNSIDGNFSTAQSCSFSYSGSPGSGGSVNGGCDVISEHIFAQAQTITSFKYRIESSASGSGSTDSGSSTNYGIQTKDATTGLWTDVPGTTASCNNNSGGGGGSTNCSSNTANPATTTITITNVIGVRATAHAGGFANESGSGSGSAHIYEIQAFGEIGQSVTFRLSKKILGQMKDYNDALVTANTRGTWTSPGLQLDAETLDKIFWNEQIVSGDDVEFFTRSGSSQSAVENAASCTATNATDIFTASLHGLSNGGRVEIGGTALPAGIDNKIIYYVVGVSGNDFQVSLTQGGAAVDFTTDGTGVTFKSWSQSYTNPNGSPITSTAASWIQYLIYFTAVDTTVSNPRAHFVDGFVVKMSYIKGGTFAEATVEFIYQIGFRNFDQPMLDKIFKKIISIHEGDTGQLVIRWKTENANGELTVDLQNNPTRFESFFPPACFGRKIDLTFYKNDLNSFRLKEFEGLYTPEPLII